ncbi:hypothetical protein NBRC111894_3485 [Sporolactobacillus inulinus]|uniref:Uncharacterized protein n=1 Tax=Sporolactobacillus inulinus TaxID=2078 RepID=A0A4Y1ZG45_9BACL|nr:hypothetical protein NBRC111894_3485 [Sporolactobacillus inulinus]
MSWPSIKAEVLWRLREQRAKEDPAGKMRVRGGSRCARGKRAAEVSFVHKVVNESRIQSKRNFR